MSPVDSVVVPPQADHPQAHRHGEIPVAVLRNPKLSAQAKGLYGCLQSYSGESGCFPAQETLCADMGCAQSTLSEWLKELIDFGCVVRKNRTDSRNMVIGRRYELVATQAMLRVRADRHCFVDTDHRPVGSRTTGQSVVGPPVERQSDHRPVGSDQHDPKQPDQQLLVEAPTKGKNPGKRSLPPCTEPEVRAYMLELGAPDRSASFEATKFIGYYFGTKARELRDWKQAARGWLTRARERDPILDRAMARKSDGHTAPLFYAGNPAQTGWDPDHDSIDGAEAEVWRTIGELYRKDCGRDLRDAWISTSPAQGGLGRLPTLADLQRKAEELRQRIASNNAA